MFEREEMFERGEKNYRSRESVRSITLNHRSHLAVYRHFIIVQKTRASFAYEMLKSLYEGNRDYQESRRKMLRIGTLRHVKFKFFQTQVVNLAKFVLLESINNFLKRVIGKIFM